jgi:signal transduction histidine kinase/CheY-like chemotaxis protein
LVVSHSIEKRVRESLREDLFNSVKTYETFEQQRETSVVRSAQMLANLPNVRALMSTDDAATIQDASAGIRELSGGDLLVLANRSGNIVGLQTQGDDFDRTRAQELLRNSIQKGDSRNWWFGGAHLYEVWLQPIYFGAAKEDNAMGVLAVGHEINDSTARDFGRVVSSEIVFQCADSIVATTFLAKDRGHLAKPVRAGSAPAGGMSGEIAYGKERYLATTVSLSSAGDLPVTLSVLKSLDQATAFLNRLNRILLGLGLLSVFAGGALVFLISHTFTRPLLNLFAGMHALEQGDFDYPLEVESRDEVGEVTGAFDRMRHSLQKTQEEQRELEKRLRQAHKMEAVGRLAGGIAHDFNNLLTVIRGNSDLLLDRGGADKAQLRYLEQIQKAADRAVSMTRQLLAFSRMQVLQPRVLDLNTTISEMSKMIPRLIGEHIEFSFVPEIDLATVLADPGQMEQVFLNLAVNARDAMPDGGKITVRTGNVTVGEAEAQQRPPMTPGRYVLFSVADTGQGMSAETKARIFEPFFTTKETGKGTGLGLATVYGIVKQTGGYIWVESTLGKGATFEIYLPCSLKPVLALNEKQQVNSLRSGGETILVVEDETGVRELASDFLASGGYTVLQAKEGAEAIGIFVSQQGEIQLLLTDMVMPRMSGLELAKNLRIARPDLRVIYMTGYAEFSGENGESALADGSILQKPFSRSALLELVQEVLRAVPSKFPGPNRAGGLS